MGKFSSALPLEPNQGTKELVEKIKLDASKEVGSTRSKNGDLRKCYKNSDAPYRRGPHGITYRKIFPK